MLAEEDFFWLNEINTDSDGFKFHELATPDATKTLETLDLAANFKIMVQSSAANFEAARIAYINTMCPMISGVEKSIRSLDVLYTLQRKAKLIFCPFSGLWKETIKSVGSESYWIEFAGRFAIVCQFCYPLYPGADSVYIFPKEKLVFYFGNMVQISELTAKITELTAAMSQSIPMLIENLNSKAPAIISVAEMRTPHFGHYVWNALSGWGYLLPQCAPNIDLYLSWAEDNYFGRITRIYPEVGQQEHVVLEKEIDMVKVICDRGLLVAFCRDKHITNDLADHVAKFARKNCLPATLHALDEMRKRCRNVIVFGLRVGNRCWLDQENGYAELARAISVMSKDCGFIIDGMSEGTTKGWTHSLMSMSEETQLAFNLHEKISQFAECINVVGKSMLESLVAIETSDFYIAAAGSGFAKYKWIYNKPGILLSNKTVLDKTNGLGWPIRVFETHRDECIESLFVDMNDVQDVAVQNRPGDSHANFNLDWKVLLPLVKTLIQ